MDTATLGLLAKYNSHANTEMNACIKQLSPENWEKEYAGFFKSVKSVCNHLYIADFAWLKRFSTLRDFSYAKDPLFGKNITWDTPAFDTIADYTEKRVELDALIGKFSRELKPADFGKILSYKNIKCEPQERNAGGLVLHMFNHQTHHRGMISLYLEFAGVPNDFSSLSVLA
jgi:uncharacterized damage-inducible protein DinB